MFDTPPKCPAIAYKLNGIFSWRHTYRVQHRQKGLQHLNGHLHKSYSLQLPRKLSPDSWVVCHHLQSQSGILDPDDKLNDVADDREQIIASFDEYNGPDSGIHQGGGDGASGSSVGTESPDMFTRPDPKAYVPVPESNHIEVTTTSEHNTSGLGLQVRRGSEPSLNLLSESTQNAYSSPTSIAHADPTKRWSAAPVCRSDTDPPERLLANYHTNSIVVLPEEEQQQPQHSHNDSMNSNFSRSGRLSMQFLGDGGGYRWMDAAERVAGSSNSQNKDSYSSKSLPREAKRKEPLGQANSCYDSLRDKKGEMLLVLNEQGTALGLTAYPDPEKAGLLVEAVEPGSRAEKGRLRRGDRIVEINGANLNGLSEKSMQEQLKRCLTASELRLRVIRGSVANRRDNRISQYIEAGEDKKSVNTSPNRKIASAIAPALQVANTRKIGRKIEIALTKGPQGLGFSVTTRDNPAGGHCPIYIKNILPKGAAVEDGRLKPGDRLLEVDGVPMTGKSQTEVVAVLRSTLLGTTVRLVVSRQELVEEREVAVERVEEAKDTPPKPPAPVMPPKTPENDFRGFKTSSMRLKRSQESVYSGFNLEDNKSVFPWRNREILTLHIPCHDTEKAGLGVSVKGKTGSPNAGQANLKHDGDLGIFVKSVINGGAASRDGRLKMNDQLLSVNGVSLLGQSNAEAMDTLRRAMIHSNSKYPGNITLTVARRISRPASIGDPLDSENSGTSENSGATVIYLNNSRDEDNTIQRWSNPVLDRLTGGTGQMKNSASRKPGMVPVAGLRNDSYYMATMDNWSPAANLNGNNGVLIEEDPEPTSPKLPNRIETDARKIQMSTSTPNGDVTYASQLSIESNPPIEAFSRDAVGRRSMSEKHHAALDAKETGTYQRNKKLREDREKERKIKGILGGSMESLADAKQRMGIHKVSGDLKAEALDKVGDLGPSLGMKKSSSLESLQTMVQEIQMSDEPRGPVCLKTPRGRGREELVRAAVEIDRPPENQPRKHWLLEDGTNDCEGGFINRHGPFQSSLTDGKVKPRQKKSSILKGIGHMFRFGKHRKDGVAPAVVTTTVQKEGPEIINGWHPSPEAARTTQTLPISHGQQRSLPAISTSSTNNAAVAAAAIPKEHRVLGGPPQYVNPPKPSTTLTNGVPTAIHQNDVFNHRYSHYVNYDELQHHINRRHQVYHSTRSSREVSTPPIAHQTRPVSTFYEYESAPFQPQGSMRKVSHSPVSSMHHAQQQQQQQKMNWHGTMSSTHGGSIKNRGPFVTQVTIRDTANHSNQPPASKV